MRDAFANDLTDIGAENDKVVLLSGDIGNRMFDRFKEAAPGRFLNCGVAEANMIGLAAGLAMQGLRPVAYTITPFITMRCLEQIRVDLCYHDLPVILIGVGSGLGYAELGATHHSLEDIACLRALPNMIVTAPADPMEVRAVFRAALKADHPVYMRIGKKGEPNVHEAVPDLALGKGLVLRRGGGICLLSTGVVLPLVLEAADILASRGIPATVVSMPTIKPLDTELIANLLPDHPVFATIEEHGLAGGFGSAVGEWWIDSGVTGARLIRFGSSDSFLTHSKTVPNARAHFGITAEAIADRTASALGDRSAA